MSKNVFKKRCFKLFKVMIALFTLSLSIVLLIIYIKKRYYLARINFKLMNINYYMDRCKKGILINGILKPYSKPKITALITSHNSENFISTAIRSVQNQDFNDIEILIIDDCSSDKTVEIIKTMKIKDKRIKLIQNKVNKGILYSKSLGVLKSNGKYIMFLDSDDLFVNKNIFLMCFNQAINYKIDVVEFSGFESHFNPFEINYTMPKIPIYLRYKKNEETIRQPELSNYVYRRLDDNMFKLIDGYLWGKTIRSKVLKDSLKQIGRKIYNIKLNYGDDRLINFVLFKVAKSFKFIREFGIVYNQNNVSITHINLTQSNCQDELTNIFFMYNFTKNTNETELAAFEIFKRFNKIIYPGLNDQNNKRKLLNMIELMMQDKYISIIAKRRLSNLTNYINI
jgi:glycosyltransferase involved in cell wall biosynthesis